jgi:Domain of unknown function (DUF4328)
MLPPNAYMQSNAGANRSLKVALIALAVCIVGGMLFSLLTDLLYSNAADYTRGLKLFSWFFSQLLNGLDLLLSAVVMVMFLIWHHRGAYNLAVIHRPLTFAPGEAVTAWLIPLFNLYFPLLRLEEVIRHYAQMAESEEDLPALGRRLRIWFVLFWVSNILGIYALIETEGNFQEASPLALISDLLRAVPIFLFLPILARMHPWEESTYAMWRQEDAARRAAMRKPYIQKPIDMEAGRAEWYREEKDAQRLMRDTDPFGE